MTHGDWTIRGNIAPRDVIIQCHRGGGEVAPENTIEAFDMAWELGGLPEADLRTTVDGVIVAFHDRNFERVVTDSNEQLASQGVADVTWEVLSQLDVGAFRGEQFRGQRVLRMSDAFSVMRGRPERRMYLDVKNIDLKALADEVNHHAVQKQVILASPRHPDLQKWSALSPDSGSLLWMGGSTEEKTARVAELERLGFAGVTQIQFHVGPRDDGDCDRADALTIPDAELARVGRVCREHGVLFQAGVFKCDDPRVFNRLLELGVMSFATDYPEITFAAVAEFVKC